MSFEEAALEKRVIELCKLPAQGQYDWLCEHAPGHLGFPSKMNAKQRREAIKKTLKESKIE
jgi:hypothetical protein